MIKNILLFILLVVSIGSLYLNYVMYDDVEFYSSNGIDMDEKDRLKKIAPELGLFSLFIDLDKRIDDLNVKEEIVIHDEFIRVANNTLSNLGKIKWELIGTSGGVDPDEGFLMNPIGIPYVKTYFFGENNFRNNGISFFYQSMADYKGAVNRLGINSSLLKSFEMHENLHKDEKMLFKNMTSVEALHLLELIESQILFDKYIYMLGLQDE